MSREYHNVPADVGQDVTAQGLIDQKNYAGNKEVERRLREDILGQLNTIRSNRQDLSTRWLRLHKMWQGKHHVRLYEGRSDIFIPRAQKVVETHVANSVAATFPGTELYSIEPIDDLSAAMIDPTKKILNHMIEQARLRTKMHLFTRAGYMLGTAVVKMPWVLRETTQYRRVPTLQRLDSGVDLPEGVPTTYTEERSLKQFEGPDFKIVDLLRWHIHPATINDIEDYQIIMEDLDVDRNFLKDMSSPRKGGTGQSYAPAYYKPAVEELFRRSPDGMAPHSDETLSLRNQRLDAYGIEVNEQVKNRYELTEIWCKFDLYNNGTLVPCKAVVVKGAQDLIILEIRQNPFYHQQTPYRAWRVRDQQDLFYGQGMLESLEAMQYALNAFMNQAVDSANFQMNQMMIVDTMRLAMNPKNLKFAPMGIIPVRGNPREIVTFQAPPDTASTGLQLVQILASLMEDEGSAQPISQGKVGRSGTSATEAALVADAANAFQKAALMKLEEEVLTPMLFDWFKLTEQYLSADAYMQVTGLPKSEVPVQTIIGDYKFRWATSVGAQDRFQGQQMMDVLQQQLQAQAQAGNTPQSVGAAGGNAAAAQAAGQPVPAQQGQGIPPELQALLGGR